MTISLVNEKQILDALHRLEPGRWPEVLDFIGYLHQRAASAPVQPAPLTARAFPERVVLPTPETRGTTACQLAADRNSSTP